jgi:hypothetical protein
VNEIAAENRAVAAGMRADPKPALGAVQWGLIGWGLLVVALSAGWLLRDRGLVNPEQGLGYWLGIVGGSLMLLLLLYPAGKRSQFLRRLGVVKHWFRIHMLFGIVGPLLILYHCNFSVDAINSSVALYSMLLVAGSGIVGRYFYARIHRGLYGKRASIEELREEMSSAIANSRGIAAILPNFVRELHGVSEQLLGDRITRRIDLGRSLAWTVKHHFIRLRLHFRINRELRARAVHSEVIRGNAGELRKVAQTYARDQVRLMRRIAQLAFYERLFSLWHVFHMPMFILLVVSALVHVLAVHMY